MKQAQKDIFTTCNIVRGKKGLAPLTNQEFLKIYIKIKKFFKYFDRGLYTELVIDFENLEEVLSNNEK
jgi:hypothetical protein